MKKYLELFLSALAVAAAAMVATRRRPQPEPQSAASPGQEPVAVLPRSGAGLVAAVASPGQLPQRTAGFAASSKDVLVAVLGRIKEHGTIMLAAGLSYYALLAVFPAAIAAVSIYGLVADPAVLEEQLAELTSALPVDTANFVQTQLASIVDSSSSTLGVATGVSIAAALWSASAGTKALISGINYAYGLPESRSFLVIRFSALGVTLGIIVFGLGAAAAVGFLPQILDAIGLENAAATLVEIGRWPVVLFLVVVGLGALYKLAPDRPWRMTRWLNPGAIVAALVWVLATFGLSVWVNNFGDFGATYGTLAGLIVLMLWFFVSGLIVLLGAEVNSELEHRMAVS